jgi:hypothetical protein
MASSCAEGFEMSLFDKHTFVDKLTRGKALQAGVATLLAVPALASAAGAAPPRTPPPPNPDLAVLTSSLGVELGAIKAYADLAAANAATVYVTNVLMSFAYDHASHRDALIAAIHALGVEPAATPASFPVPQLANEAAALDFALGLERNVAAAHLATVSQYATRGLAQKAAAMLGCETTHVALLSEALRKGPAYPDGFVAPASSPTPGTA